MIDARIKSEHDAHYFSFTLASNASPTTKYTTSAAMPAFWLAVIAVTMPTISGAVNDVTFPDNANSPKYCVIRSSGANLINSVRDPRRAL